MKTEREQITKLQQEWYETNFKNLLSSENLADFKNVTYSNPFFYAEPERLRSPKIMVVGQEPLNFKAFEQEIDISVEQNWTVDLLECRAYGVKDTGKDRSSPFWKLFKLMYQSGLNPTWNNLDKATRVVRNGTKEKTEVLWVIDEMILDEPLESTGKSLLQSEIEISKPDAVVFVTGPTYYKSMAKSLQCDENTLLSYRLKKEDPFKDITAVADIDVPCLWTYHPAYLARLAKENKYLWDLVKKVKLGSPCHFMSRGFVL